MLSLITQFFQSLDPASEPVITWKIEDLKKAYKKLNRFSQRRINSYIVETWGDDMDFAQQVKSLVPFVQLSRANKDDPAWWNFAEEVMRLDFQIRFSPERPLNKRSLDFLKIPKHVLDAEFHW